MNGLLDTQSFLWWVTDHPLLPARVRDIISDGSNTLFLSAASAWEISIKAQIGKLALTTDPGSFVRDQIRLNAFEILPISLDHALAVYALPMIHRDPFDRILVAQSQVEGLPILTGDPGISQYQVEVIW